MPEYTEGIAGDGAAILKDGVPMSVSEVIAELNRANALEEALRAIADGRGMVPDKSTIYMNGRTPEVPTIFNKHDMQEVAKRALEATCQKK